MKDNVGKCYISKPGKSSKILKKEPKKMGKWESTVNWNTEDLSSLGIWGGGGGGVLHGSPTSPQVFR